jgi:hypothetical protein
MLQRSTGVLDLIARQRIVVAFAAVALAGCDGEKVTSQLLPGQPDTTGAAVWQYLQSASYQTTWQTWPGKGKLYTGQEPHGMLLTTYLNDIAYGALTNKAGQFPRGTIIIKENYMPDSTLAAVTTMYKVQDYNREAGNWFWVKHLPDGTVDGGAQGRVGMCIGCHAARSNNDYIYTAPLK